MSSLKILSPAKVNLFLRVLGRRRDGYHEIFTLFHRISLADTLTLKKTVSCGIRIKTYTRDLPVDSRNILWKAFNLLRKQVRIPGGVSITLKKQIPIGGGLGGGSSNAASFLLGMRRLYRLGVSKRTLERLGAQLGADVNFFLRGMNQALGCGVGEKLRGIPRKKPLWFMLVTFPKSLSTATVYRLYSSKKSALYDSHQKAPSLTKENQVAKLERFFKSAGACEIAPFLTNDLEPVSRKLYPPIGKALELFRNLGIKTGLMSGSGSTVFSVHPTRADALRVKRAFLAQFRLHKRIFIARTF